MSAVVRAWPLVPLVLAGLEILHPTWTSTSVGEEVRDVDKLWLAVHVLLLLGYGLLVAILWQLTRSRAARGLLAMFLVGNSAYLVVDGILIGLLAQSDPVAADALWAAPWVSALADATGATWAASLLLVASSATSARDWPSRVGYLVAWIAFVVSAAPVIGAAAAAVSRIAALSSGGWAVYRKGTTAIPLALLVFAAVLHQHVGGEAALGLIFVAIATARSNPGAASPL